MISMAEMNRHKMKSSLVVDIEVLEGSSPEQDKPQDESVEGCGDKFVFGKLGSNVNTKHEKKKESHKFFQMWYWQEKYTVVVPHLKDQIQ